MSKSTTEYAQSTHLPRQKLPISKKNQTWREECMDAAISMIGIYSSSRRSSKYKMQKNYDLLNGRINKSDLEYAVNPLGLDLPNFSFPATIQPYDVWSPIFYELIGEEARRPFSFIVRSINEDAISQKEVALKQQILEQLQSILTSNEEIQEGISAIEKASMSYQDMRESIATKILTYLKKDLHLDMVFQKGWEDALVAGEEVYAVEEISNEPRLRRVNPMELYYILPHNSDIIDDAEVIVEETYMSLSQIIDNFYEKLTPKQITNLESGISLSSDYTSTYIDHANVVIHDSGYTPEFFAEGSPYRDHRGNFRVCKVTWKSKKKIKRIFYRDEFDQLQETIRSEEYILQPGETEEELWINEYWEGYKIGTDLYLDAKPKRLQFRRMDNLSTCKSGYIGSVYNCNNSQSTSLMDRLTPFIYLYIIIWYNTELAIATNMGKIAMIDVSTMPDGWTIDQWMHYAKIMKVGFVDSYSEGAKGERKGQYNQSQKNIALDLETGNYIQQHVTLLQFIEQKIKHLAGVPEQRMGDIAASELVGNTERAVVQASFVTEKWFQFHNFNKQRALDALIETAKVAWEGKSKKLQYVTDELTTAFFTVDGNEFPNSEYGTFVSNSAKDTEALTTLKQLMQAALQNDKASLSTIIDVLNSESIADTKNKLIKAEEESYKRQQENIQLENQGAAQVEQMKQELEIEKLDREDMNKQLDRENKIAVAEISALGFSKDSDIDDNGIPDILEMEKLKQKDTIDRENIKLEKQKLTIQKQSEDKKLKHEKEMKEKDLRKAKLDNQTKIKVASMRPKPTVKKK